MTWTLDHVQLAIPETAEPRARAFWTGPLGFAEIPKPPALRGRGGLWLRRDGAEVHLGVERPFAPARKAHPCFALPGIDALARSLAAAGTVPRFDGAIAGRRRFFCDDPFGNRLEFVALPSGGAPG